MATNDMALVQEYAQRNSEQAFAALVSRYVNLVYSVALRQVHDSHLAEDVTQGVFIILARKAKSLAPNTILSSWLCRTARNVSAHALRQQRRRQVREQEAHMESITNESDANAWDQIAPMLDEALSCLGKKEHDAVILRFFEGKEFTQVGAEMGTTEDGARMRVNRGLERLRGFFTKRGVILSGAAIAAAVSVNSVQAAPTALAVAVTTAAAKGGTVSGALMELVKGTMKTMTWVKMKFAIGMTSAILLGGSGVIIVLSAESVKQGAQTGQQAPILIVPGARVGNVVKGMTTNEVEAVLGKPEKWQGKIMVYDQRLGMSVAANKRGVTAVFCGDSLLKYPGVKAFKGHTKEGIGMESSREDVIKAFGQPTTAKPWDAGVVMQEQLEYKDLGLTFTLESHKVINILVDFRTAADSAGPQ
ncbi:MAG TPA: sigma-70 family RNA polymerase sigma factor [Verrucomicrobiae bacterium]|jgi:RNA polymerase sigma factor (sigma-70 family)|nr:sigma-70 family RNA polymerase sigma factor [Verrucomicrobiae bacterium]